MSPSSVQINKLFTKFSKSQMSCLVLKYMSSSALFMILAWFLRSLKAITSSLFCIPFVVVPVSILSCNRSRIFSWLFRTNLSNLSILYGPLTLPLFLLLWLPFVIVLWTRPDKLFCFGILFKFLLLWLPFCLAVLLSSCRHVHECFVFSSAYEKKRA